MTTRKSATRRGASDIRVLVRRKNLNDNYLIAPNDLFRGHGVYACLEPLERLWLGAGLSCANDWETTLAEIEKWIPMGRNRHEAMRRKLREEGFLTMRPVHRPAGARDDNGRSAGGRLMWEYEFHMDPLPEAERDELQPKKDQTGGDAGNAPPMPRDQGHGSGAEESAGQAMPLIPGPGSPGHGSPGPGDGGGTPYIEKNDLEEEQPPPTPRPEPAPPPDREAEEGGDFPQSERLDPDLDRIVGWFAARKVAWGHDAIRDALVGAVTRELGTLTEAAQALREIVDGVHDAAEGPTDSPRRLYARPNAAWWSSVRDRRVAAAEARRRAGKRCSRRGHERQLADGCALCRAEAKSRSDDTRAHPAARNPDPDRIMRRYGAAASRS